LKILFLGDSLTEYCDWPEFFPDKEIQNHGISGDTTDGILYRLDRVIDGRPDKIFLMAGINDIFMGRPVAEIAGNYGRILERIKDRLPDAELFVQSVLPTDDPLINGRVERLNDEIKAMAEGLTFRYLALNSSFASPGGTINPEYSADGVHLTKAGYAAWAGLIRGHVI
jgi:lysophospholipase L1-like esterase